MDDQEYKAPSEQRTPAKSAYKSPDQGKNNKKTWIFIVIIVLLIVAIGAVYWWTTSNCNKEKSQRDGQISQLQSQKSDLEKQLAEAKTKAEAIKPESKTSCKPPSTSATNNIRDAISSGNTAALEGFMAPKVSVILAASEGFGDRTPQKAVEDITSFVKNATVPWVFNLSSDTINKYASGDYGKYFPENAVVGKSYNMLISFSFDCSGKISTVFLTNSTSVL